MAPMRLALCAFVASCARGAFESLSGIDFVNPYIGTGGNGYGTGGLPLAAQVPFGAVRLGADTCQLDEEWSPWEHTGGYYYRDKYIRMLSHTHLVGAGVVDYGAVGMLPTTETPARVGKTDWNRFPWMQPFSHDDEVAQPGYYSVYLPQTQIQIELTATQNVGLHRYTFGNASAAQYILFDSSYTLQYDACHNASFTIDGTNNEVTGVVHEMGTLSKRFGGVLVYYVVHFSQPFSSAFGTWSNGQRVVERKLNATDTFSMSGNDIGFWLEFDAEHGDTIEMSVAISFISIEQARQNLEHDLNGTDFDGVKNQTQQIWREKLDLVTIENIDASYVTRDNLTVFYTALYHTLLAPTKFSEAKGRYKGFDDEIHLLADPSRGYYTDVSGWDVFRSEFPWLALIEPTVLADVMQSLVLMFEQGGDLPRWPLANGYTNCMFGTHANIMMADAVAHELWRSFDIDTAYEAMYRSATTSQSNAGRTDVADYIALGFVPFESSSHGACLTLAYAYDDWAIARVAYFLRRTEDQEMFLNRSTFWFNVWSADAQFMCPRFKANGSFECPRDPLSLSNDLYVEGNAWHYRFYAPHDVSSLQQAWGDTDHYVAALSEFLDRSFDDEFDILPNPYYWAGNEEDLFAVWQFAFAPASRQDLTASYSRQLLERHYTNAPDGLPGNDDFGTMSAWALFALLGFYPRAGDGCYVVGSPFFNELTLHRERGDIHIKTHNAPNVYVVNASISGEQLESPIFAIAEMIDGAEIEFWMDSEPREFWPGLVDCQSLRRERDHQ